MHFFKSSSLFKKVKLYSIAHGPQIVIILLLGGFVVFKTPGSFIIIWDNIIPIFDPSNSLNKAISAWDTTIVGGRPYINAHYIPYIAAMYLLTALFNDIYISHRALHYLAFSACGVNMYILTVRSTNTPHRKLAGLTAGLCYMFNTFWIMRVYTTLPNMIFFLLPALPVLVLCTREALYSNAMKDTFKWLCAASMLYALSAPSFANLPVALFTYLFINVYILLKSVFNRKIRRGLFVISLFCLLMLLNNLWWILPSLLHPSVVAALQRQESYKQGMLISLRYWSKVANELNVIRCLIYGHFNTIRPSNTWFTHFGLYSRPLFILLSILIPVMSTTALYKSKNNDECLLYGMILVLTSLILAAGGVLSPVIFWLAENVPLFVFRRPSTFQYILHFLYSYLFGVSISELIPVKTLYNQHQGKAFLSLNSSLKRLRLIAIIIIVLLSIVVYPLPEWLPGYSGYYNAITVNRDTYAVSAFVDPPHYVLQMSEFLNNIDDDGGVLILPINIQLRAYNWTHGYFGPDPYYFLLKRPVLSHVMWNYPQYYYYCLLHDIVHGEQRIYNINFTRLLNLLGIRYIIVAEDSLIDIVKTPSFNITLIHASLRRSKGIMEIARFGPHVLYRLVEQPRLFYIPQWIVSPPFFENTVLSFKDYLNRDKNNTTSYNLWTGSSYINSKVVNGTLILHVHYTEDLVKKKWYPLWYYNSIPFNLTKIARYLIVRLKTSKGIGVKVMIGRPEDWKTGLFLPLSAENPTNDSLPEQKIYASNAEFYNFIFRIPSTIGRVDYLTFGLMPINPRKPGNYTVYLDFSFFECGITSVDRALAALSTFSDPYSFCVVRPTVYSKLSKQMKCPITHPGIIKIEKIGTSHYRIHIKGARNPFILCFMNIFDDGWVCVKSSKKFEHICVNGIYNGWIINEIGSFMIDVYYEKQLIMNLCFLLGMISCTIYCLVIVLISFKMVSRGEICFVGPDGTGKTTHAKTLKNILSHYYKIDSLYMHIPTQSIMARITSRLQEKTAKTKIATNSLLRMLVRLLLLFIDSLLTYAYIRLKNTARLLILDRYFYDSYIDIAMHTNNIMIRSLCFRLIKVIPRPRVVILFIASPNLIFQRRPEIRISIIKQLYKLYTQCLPRLVRIDKVVITNKPFTEVSSVILKSLINRISTHEDL